MDPGLHGSDAPLSKVFDVALLDLDGVVYIGRDAVPAAPAALERVRTDGMRLAFVTNNAARAPYSVADHLTELGIPAKAGDVINSAQAAARYLADRLPGGARVLVIGTVGLVEALRERGLVPVADAEGQVDAVVQGYSPELDWPMLAEGAVAINRGVPWVATNTDLTVPSSRGPLPGNGATVAALRAATGVEPTVTGKPDPTMHRETLLRTQAQRPIVVGDRLDTDIEGANAVGCPSLLVFTGITTVRVLLAAEPRHRPNYLGADVGALLQPHPRPESTPDGTRCGRWRVRVHGEELQLTAVGDASNDASNDDAAAGAAERGAGGAAAGASLFDLDTLDCVRALCTARWALSDAGAAPIRAGEPPVVPGDDAARNALERLSTQLAR